MEERIKQMAERVIPSAPGTMVRPTLAPPESLLDRVGWVERAARRCPELPTRRPLLGGTGDVAGTSEVFAGDGLEAF